MRILYVGRSAKIGGGSTFRLNISRGLRKRGHEIWVACQPGEMLKRFREIGVHYVWTPPAPWGGPWIEGAIRAHGIELVHASNPGPGKAAEWACKRTGTPMIMSVHGMLGRHDYTATCLQRALRILTFEEVAVEKLTKHPDQIDPQKIVLLRRPIEHRPHSPEDGGPFRVAYVGRLSKRKGRNALELMKAFERFQEVVPESRLQLVGDGSQLREVRRAAGAHNEKRGLPAITVLGTVNEVVPIVGRAHVVVGASYCALEAIMQGVAVIGAGFWGYGVVDEENLRDAMAWNFGDVGGKWEMSEDNFLEALLRLHERWVANQDRERYWRLDRFIKDEHSLDNVAAKIESIYDDVLRSAPERRGTIVPAPG